MWPKKTIYVFRCGESGLYAFTADPKGHILPSRSNAVLRAALYMPALSAMRYNPAIVALVTRLKSRGRLKPKQIVVAAMRKLLVLCFGVLKTGKPFDPAIAMGC